MGLLYLYCLCIDSSLRSELRFRGVMTVKMTKRHCKGEGTRLGKLPGGSAIDNGHLLLHNLLENIKNHTDAVGHRL